MVQSAKTTRAHDDTPVQVIGKAAKVLKACHALGPGLSLGDIARAAHIYAISVPVPIGALCRGASLVRTGVAKHDPED